MNTRRLSILNGAMANALQSFKPPSTFELAKREFFKKYVLDKVILPTVKLSVQGLTKALDPHRKVHKLGLGTKWWLEERGLSLSNPLEVVKYLDRQKIYEWTIFDEMLYDPEVFRQILSDPAYRYWP